jgi:hypothetical protein
LSQVVYFDPNIYEAVGYAVYFNVFYNRLVPNLKEMMAPVIGKALQTRNVHIIEEIISLTGNSLINQIKHIPEVAAHPGSWDKIVEAGRLAYADAYKYVYYVSIGKLIPTCTVSTNASKCLASSA